MIMSSSRLRIILVCALIGGCIGTVLQALLISGRTKEFRSLAKLVATMQMNFNDNACWREQQLDWYGMIIETLESAEMKRRASQRVKALHPDLKDSGVTIRAIRSKNTSFFNLLATGPDPKYTRIFLGVLIDEFFAFRESLLERADGKVLRQFFEEVEDHQKKLEDLTKTLENARAKLASLSAKSDQERLIPRLKMLKLQRDGLRLELNSLLAANPSRAPVEKKLGAVELDIQAIETELQRFESGMSELRKLTEKQEAEKATYQRMLDGVDQFNSALKPHAEYITVLQPATPATEHVDDWRWPIVAGAGGGLLGGLVGLLLSLVIVQSPKPPQIPAGVV